MPLQNRVTPTGEFMAVSDRGDLMGNRGILHDENRTLGKSRWKTPGWVACRLEYKGKRRQLMAPGRYTELFFLDEAVSLAAGHRPCFRCRREDLRHFMECWSRAHPEGNWRLASEIDKHLHVHRIRPWRREQITFTANLADLPDGCFVCLPGETIPMLVLGEHLLPYSTAGYGQAINRGTDAVTVLTPEPVVRTLSAGYRPKLHASVCTGT